MAIKSTGFHEIHCIFSIQFSSNADVHWLVVDHEIWQNFMKYTAYLAFSLVQIQKYTGYLAFSGRGVLGEIQWISWP